MVVSCSVFNCKRRSDKKEPGVTFHRFPKEDERKKRWVLALKLDRDPTRHDRVCSKHFEEKCFNTTSSKRYLLYGAVPTIFSELPTIHLPKDKKKEKREEKVSYKEKEKTKNENIVLTFSALQGSLIKDNENVSENYAVSSADPEKQVEWSNVEAVCRGCLHIKDLKNMKETMVGDLNAIRVYEIITKKQLNMRIPAMMCLECVEKLSKTHKFLLMLESSNKVLENALNEITNLKNDIKEELEDEQLNEDQFLLDCSDAGDEESSNDEVPLSERFKSAMGEAESFKNYVSEMVVVSAICQICSKTVIDLNKHIIENHQLDKPEGINDPIESVNPRKTKGVHKRHIIDEDEEDVGINFEKILKYDKEKVKKLRSKLLTIKDSRKLLPDIKRKVTIYRCKYCIHLEFHGYKDIEIHFKEQHPTDKTCIICEQEFSCFLNALYHMMKKHGKIKCCRLCLVSFKTNDQLMEHYKSDEHNKKCKICNREFKNRKMLYDHRRKYHLNPELINKKYKCPKCPKEFANHNNIRRHILCFHNMVRYLCDTCGQSYTTNRNLRFHILKFHQGQEVEVKTTRKNYFCETCGRELKIFHKYAIAQHTAKHKGHNYVCRRCHESFETEQEFEAHVEQEGHQLLKCPHCNAEFVREESFNTHLKNHDAPGWNKNYFVRYNKKTSQSRNLNGEFECSYCSKSFKIKQRLDNHIRVHTNERPYKCDYCSKAFKTWIHRKTHLAVHLGIKNYQCRFCSKAFTYASTLRGHEMIHTGERPSTCPECKKGFISTSAMKKHLMTHFRGRHANKSAVLDIQKKEEPDMEISYIDNEIYMESGTNEKQFVKKNQV
ncbi:zinc finger protein 724-like isoform X3 [Sitophilus oryzae]|uniref:Zinc finger protein 724-like isoform X3 n=1 Tax=Sitophilus oryzae TaxID=7048 RepID=A0A6J2XES4_SITOR|nr:zinc finger protein 724-like isoform X3 [Sitophilus oryzae]